MSMGPNRSFLFCRCPAPGLFFVHLLNLCSHTAPVPVSQLYIPGEIIGHFAKLYRFRACMQSKLHPDGKKHAIPGLHRDSYLPKVPRHCPVTAPGNTTSLYCRAVRLSKNLPFLFITMGPVILQKTMSFVS